MQRPRPTKRVVEAEKLRSNDFLLGVEEGLASPWSRRGKLLLLYLFGTELERRVSKQTEEQHRDAAANAIFSIEMPCQALNYLQRRDHSPTVFYLQPFFLLVTTHLL